MVSASEYGSRPALARTWSLALGPITEIPLSSEMIEECLRGQVDIIVDALLTMPFVSCPARGAAESMVTKGIDGGQVLGRTVEILGQALPRLPELRAVEDLPDKIASVLGAIATGFSTRARQPRADHHVPLREVFDAAPNGIMISGLTGAIVEANAALTEILRCSAAELSEHHWAEFFEPEELASLRVGYQSLLAGQRKRFQRRATMLSGPRREPIRVAITVSVLRDPVGNPTRYVTTIVDITDQELLEEQVRYQSLHDILTGLPNRQHLSTRLEELLERDRHAAITMYKIDLDSFGVVTDGLGTGVGDLLLISVAQRLQALIAEEKAFLARFGGDEFAILIEESPSTPNAAVLAARINDELSEPVYIAGRGLALSSCIGVARRIPGHTDARELIRMAEATLHRASRTGRGQWGCYDPIADARERARYALVTDMPGAWEDGEVTLSYQPLVRIDPEAPDAGRTVALAALMRWEHPERGLVPHEDALAYAEQTGLVLKLGPWLLGAACEHLQGWRHRLGAAAPPVRIDLTAHLAQHPDLIAMVLDTLAATGLQPQDIQLGIPVEPIAGEHGEAVDNVGTLADIGVATVLIRYGQTVGNLVLVESLPVRGVELAGSVVRNAAAKPDSALCAALAGLVPLLRRADVTVVVGDIDDMDQAAWWRDVGADAARGAAYSAPVAPEDVPSLLI